MSRGSGLPDVSARDLRAVVLVARYLSFIAAAAELHLSQPGLSRVIRKVEQELGVALFHRSTRQVALTAAGAQFVPVAERLLQDLAVGVEAVRDLANQTRGHVAIGCPMSVAQSNLIGIVLEYRRLLRFNRSSQQQDEPSAAPGQTSRRAFATQVSSVAWH